MRLWKNDESIKSGVGNHCFLVDLKSEVALGLLSFYRHRLKRGGEGYVIMD